MRKGWELWEEGKYLDMWSVSHFLSGLLIASVLFLLGIAFVPALVIATVLFVLYELFEVVVHIEESFTNRFMDVVVDVVGFLFATYFFVIIEKPPSIPLLFVLLLALIFLEVWGFTAWKKRMRGD